MTAIYLSGATLSVAEGIQRDHGPADNAWWCTFCLTHHRLRIKAGECAPFLQAAAAIRLYRDQQASRQAAAQTGDSVSR